MDKIIYKKLIMLNVYLVLVKIYGNSPKNNKIMNRNPGSSILAVDIHDMPIYQLPVGDK